MRHSRERRSSQHSHHIDCRRRRSVHTLLLVRFIGSPCNKAVSQECRLRAFISVLVPLSSSQIKRAWQQHVCRCIPGPLWLHGYLGIAVWQRRLAVGFTPSQSVRPPQGEEEEGRRCEGAQSEQPGTEHDMRKVTGTPPPLTMIVNTDFVVVDVRREATSWVEKRGMRFLVGESAMRSRGFSSRRTNVVMSSTC